MKMKPFFPALLVAGLLSASDPSVAQEKRAIPADAAQQEALELVKEVYGDEWQNAQSHDQKQALATKLLDKAKESSDHANRYVLLNVAQDMAVQAGDVTLALQAVDLMSARYDVNAYRLKGAALSKAAKSATLPNQRIAIAQQSLAVIAEAIEQDDFTGARYLTTLAMTAAREGRDYGLVEQVALRSQEVEGTAQACERIQGELETLVSNSQDPDANLAVGAYYCFFKGDWNRGLPMLALSKDPLLQPLAKRELAGTAIPEEEAELGDAWWNIALDKEGTTQKRIQQHAARWYRQALPSLTGLNQAKVEKRLQNVADTPEVTALKPTVQPKWRDLLADINPAKHCFTKAGNQERTSPDSWSRTTAGFATTRVGAVGFEVPSKLPDEYDLAVDMTLSGHNNKFSDTHIGLPLGDKSHTFTIRLKEKRALLSFWGGAGFGEDPKLGLYMPWDGRSQRYRVLFQVRRDGITVQLGNRTVAVDADPNYMQSDVPKPLRIVTTTPTVVHSMAVAETTVIKIDATGYVTGWNFIDMHGGKCDPETACTVKDGILICSTDKGYCLASNQAFDAVVFKVEFCYPTSDKISKYGGSIVVAGIEPDLNSSNWPEKIPRGIELCLAPGRCGEVLLPSMKDYPTDQVALPLGQLRDGRKITRLREKDLPVGQWNRLETEWAVNGNFTVKLNGELVNGMQNAKAVGRKIFLWPMGSEIHFRNPTVVVNGNEEKLEFNISK